jgi:hypothetical protein
MPLALKMKARAEFTSKRVTGRSMAHFKMYPVSLRCSFQICFTD